MHGKPDGRIETVVTSDSATEALRLLQEQSVDAVFLDIRMPGLSGVDLARVLSRFKAPPPVVSPLALAFTTRCP